MAHDPVLNNKYSYIHHDDKSSMPMFDIHEIFITRKKEQVFLSYLGTFLLLASVCYLILMKEALSLGSFCSTIMAFLFARSLQYKSVKKETVVIMPAFGVQLESHLWSGRVNRRFVPISKILKPVINECVTPVTCYWSLCLILHGDEELTLVFKELRPPVKMLIPVWKALCKATTDKENSMSSEVKPCC